MTMNSKGMTLMSVMIAASLSVVVALGLASILSNSNKGVKGVRNRADYEDLKSVVRLVSYEENKCAGIFQDAAGTPVLFQDAAIDIGQITMGGTKLLAVAAAGDVSRSVRVTRIQLSPLSGAGTGTPSAGNHAILVQIDADVVGESFGAKKFSEKIPMLVTTDAAGQITSCEGQSVTNPVEEMCAQMGLTFDAAAGNCGVVVTALNCKNNTPPQVMVGIDSNGQVQCGDAPAAGTTPGASCTVTGKDMNEKCWPLLASVDNNKGWRRDGWGDDKYLTAGAYCSAQQADCVNKGGVVTDVDTSDTKKDFRYCSARYSATYKPAKDRGKCRTWTDKSNVRQRLMSCACS
ncbi:MAG: hypothetical protein ABIR96_04475 [Bdellovibrionota bacterium]